MIKFASTSTRGRFFFVRRTSTGRKWPFYIPGHWFFQNFQLNRLWVYLSSDHPFQSATAYFITKCDGLLLQSATTVLTKCDRYYKVYCRTL